VNKSDRAVPLSLIFLAVVEWTALSHSERRIVGNEDLREAFVRPLFLARRVLEQERRQRGRKVYSLHAPEVECVGKGKAHRPYEFGVKVRSPPR